MIVGGIASVFGAISQGQAQARQANAAASAAQYNAQVAQNNAQYTAQANIYQQTVNASQQLMVAQQGAAQQNQIAAKNRATLGAQQAAAGANGVVGGSYSDLMAMSMQNGEQNALQARYNNELQQWKYATDIQGTTMSNSATERNFSDQSTLYNMQASNDRAAASAAGTNTIFAGIGAAAGAASGIYGAVSGPSYGNVKPIFAGNGNQTSYTY
jgi:hypothetical protein